MKINTVANGIKPLALVTVMAITALNFSGCGSDSKNLTSNDPVAAPSKAFDCTDNDTVGARVICIGAVDDLSDQRIQDDLIAALAVARTGDTFILPAGRYNFNSTIEFNGLVDNVAVSNLTFRGAGKDKTIIDASGAAADGFLINNTNYLTFEDFGIYESNNNALKVTKSNGVIMRNMATVWETDYQASNGAYGLYPVETSNVLIEDCFVKGSADAGIYVGQSDKIVVRNNIAEKNVAGIEVENSTNADVYGNTARGNTGGILVFDLPIGNGKYGSGVRVFDNEITANNAPNFANTGTFAGGVHIVPPGTGVIVLSTSDVEIYHNRIRDHQTISIAIASYILADEKVAQPPKANVGMGEGEVQNYGDIHPYATAFMDGWSPFVRNLNIHNNTITVADGIDNPQGDLIKDLITGFKAFHNENPDIADGKITAPHILYDGIAELLANTPHPEGQGESMIAAIVAGFNDVAAGIKANIPGAQDYTPINMAVFAAYGEDSGVCQSDIALNDPSLFAASVYQTSATADTFSTGAPREKLQLLAGGVSGVANAIMRDPNGVMNCASENAFRGSPATVTFNTETFGCTADDRTQAACAL